ncbi:MAG: hypothetical protein WBM25_03785 [Azonexus sp.]
MAFTAPADAFVRAALAFTAPAGIFLSAGLCSTGADAFFGAAFFASAAAFFLVGLATPAVAACFVASTAGDSEDPLANFFLATPEVPSSLLVVIAAPSVISWLPIIMKRILMP